MGKYGIREQFTLAVHGDTPELERNQVERCIDEVYGLIYEELEPALARLRSECTPESLAALHTVERCYSRAIEYAARGGTGRVTGASRRPTLPRAAIPVARVASKFPVSDDAEAPPGRDAVLDIRYSPH